MKTDYDLWVQLHEHDLIIPLPESESNTILISFLAKEGIKLDAIIKIQDFTMSSLKGY